MLAVVFWREYRKEQKATKQKVTISTTIQTSPGSRSWLSRVGKGAAAKLVAGSTEHEDSWEGGFWDAADPKDVEATLKIAYRDGNDNRTKRVVDVRRFDDGLYGGVMIGHCRLRDATRTFRFDRIERCIDVSTGEIVADVRTLLNALYEESPRSAIDALASDHLDIAKILLFVAKADGQFRRDEKLVIARYLRSLLRDERITLELIDDGFRDVHSPSLHGFKLAVGRVLTGGEVSPIELRDCCHEIVATQKAVHPSEQAALDYVDRRCASA